MIVKIKDKLYNNPDLIYNVLEYIGCTKIKKDKIKGSDVFKFGHDKESSGGANIINWNNLLYHSFSKNIHGDIFTLTCEMKGIELYESTKLLSDFLGLKYEYKKEDIVLPFGGFWKELESHKNNFNDDEKSITYDDSRYDMYTKSGVSQLWIKDGISALTQEEFNIGYCTETNRITIPWYNIDNKLVGIVARLNKKDMTEDEYKYKYFSLIPFNKGKNLYGLYQNYKNILNKNQIIIVESEKSVLKARQYGYDNVVALGCNNITDIQSKLIKTMCCNVVICLDEGIELQHCIEQVNKCRILNPFFTTELYIADMDKESNENITEDKVCLFDLGKEVINNTFKEHLIYID